MLWETERARDVKARLAVAEERLRFGRDLHDLMGRNLALIGLKAEPAVQLGRRGRPEAVKEPPARPVPSETTPVSEVTR
ncbi:histidine kinase [Streptomyces thermodiastaticus]|uniref:histidine kinase n=1 Tax=Streptomyces thermodiastaticus TaxID=44061 RepID=UPI0019900BE6|nr:hypothetical protein GCM10018787_50140 [Streptomyces thermodiastaticus]